MVKIKRGWKLIWPSEIYELERESIGDEGGGEAEEKTGKWTITGMESTITGRGGYHPRGENIITGRGKEWKCARVGLCHRPLPGQVGERLGRELGKWRSGALVLVDQPAPCLCGRLLTT